MPLPLAPASILELWAVAAQAGEVQPESLNWLQGLPLTPEAAALLARLPDLLPHNPDVRHAEREDASYARRCDTLKALTRPGDLVFWRSLEPGLPWNVLRTLYGPWMHVSLVLDETAWLDPYWPEGAVISTPEAAVAKASRRIRATEMAIVRPAGAWEPQALRRLQAASREAVGRPYGLMGTAESEAVSCSRLVSQLLAEQGLDLLGQRHRLFACALAPRDIYQAPLAIVRRDGSLCPHQTDAFEPAGWFGQLVRQTEQGLHGSPWLRRGLLASGPGLTELFMRLMEPAPLSPSLLFPELAAGPQVG
ncbi:MAG: hypothetical protein VKP62_14665 [Candidatus Sericytochromatia bacterium]|nr:hypothetical protein [Candidatus Sericytochromatia bacterium]